MPASADPGGDPKPPTLVIPEIRDYQRINAELANLLDRGHPRILLEGAEGQRLLASGLSGPWRATIEFVGPTGPELAADLDAPSLTIVARGPTADGAGRGLRSGRLLVLGGAGDAVGCGQSGGLLVVQGPVGHRAGLGQSGGTLVVLGPTGRLPADRQVGGWFFVRGGAVGTHPGRGRSGGRLIEIHRPGIGIEPDDLSAWEEAMSYASPWLAPSSPTEGRDHLEGGRRDDGTPAAP